MVSAKLTFIAGLVSLASAHIGMFDKAGMYDAKPGITWAGQPADKSYAPAIPLGAQNGENAPVNGAFWFHGADIAASRANGGNNPATGTQKKLQAGGSVTLELACNRQWTSLGDGANNNPNGEACPDGVEVWKSRHVSSDPSKEVYLGCGLAIAYKDAATLDSLDDIKASDMTIFSVVEDCVKKKDTTFQIPKEMPACPPGGCVCAWFWQGQDSADEMYMTGFFCDVEGGNASLQPGTPQVAKYCPNGGCVEGPKQPLIWANTDSLHPSNVEKVNGNKPGYTTAWGFRDGPQQVVSGASSGNTSGGSNSGTDKGTETDSNTDDEDSIPTIPTTPAPGPTFAPPLAEGGHKGWNNKKQGQDQTNTQSSRKSSESCGWPGHCRGDPCTTYNDCWDTMICGAESTCVPLSAKFRRSIIERA